MLNNKGFDLWADNYDKSVKLSEESDKYPFAGYKKVLGTIYNTIKSEDGKKILDIGFGTGILSKKLYDEGCTIYGIDFSEKMIKIAKEKMPKANLIKHNFTEGLPKSLENEKFDFIICTYAIHHLKDADKVSFIKELINHLNKGGKVLIGDVAFETKEELVECKEKSKDCWDDDEIYAVVENINKAFDNMKFEKITFCSGVFIFN